jgi:hypothetical protein
MKKDLKDKIMPKYIGYGLQSQNKNINIGAIIAVCFLS